MKARLLLRPLFLTVGLALLAGCARYPMGLTKSEWDALTPGQQARYRRLQESENRDYLRDWDGRQKDTDSRVKDIERRVQMGPDGYTPPSN